ncbi:MAG: hypothetical protein ABIB47_04520 [Candidatus Woesearchaeota archaeon]
MKDKPFFKSKSIFYILLGIFILLIIYFAVPALPTIRRALFPFAAILAFFFFILGTALIFYSLKLKAQKKLKIFLLLTGASAVGFLVFVLLHNLVYGLFIYLFGEAFWESIGMGDEPFFFILAIFVCPIVFLIGAIGSLILFHKKRKTKT